MIWKKNPNSNCKSACHGIQSTLCFLPRNNTEKGQNGAVLYYHHYSWYDVSERAYILLLCTRKKDDCTLEW